MHSFYHDWILWAKAILITACLHFIVFLNFTIHQFLCYGNYQDCAAFIWYVRKIISRSFIQVHPGFELRAPGNEVTTYRRIYRALLYHSLEAILAMTALTWLSHTPGTHTRMRSRHSRRASSDCRKGIHYHGGRAVELKELAEQQHKRYRFIKTAAGTVILKRFRK